MNKKLFFGIPLAVVAGIFILYIAGVLLFIGGFNLLGVTGIGKLSPEDYARARMTACQEFVIPPRYVREASCVPSVRDQVDVVVSTYTSEDTVANTYDDFARIAKANKCQLSPSQELINSRGVYYASSEDGNTSIRFTVQRPLYATRQGTPEQTATKFTVSFR